MKERELPSISVCKSRARFSARHELRRAIRFMPAPDIPLERSGHEHLKPVAKHEAEHADASIKLGKGMSRLTIKRRGNTLGSMTPARIDSIASHQIIAMASSADKHPEGTGSDVYTAKMLESEPGAISVGSALSNAQGIHAQKSELKWDTLADLVAYKGEKSDLTESDFKELDQRADWETEMIEKYGQPIPLEKEGDIFVSDHLQLKAA